MIFLELHIFRKIFQKEINKMFIKTAVCGVSKFREQQTCCQQLIDEWNNWIEHEWSAAEDKIRLRFDSLDQINKNKLKPLVLL